MPPCKDSVEFECTRKLEDEAFREGWRLIAGCDETGRGSLLGPLYAAAVILDPAKPIPGVNDSKQLTPRKREALAKEITDKAIAFQIVSVSAAEVDCLNVYEASRQGMLRALQGLNPAPDFALTDAMPLAGARESAAIPHRAVIHGDALSVSIAAASILAKVARDAHLRELDRLYPQYGLAENKGYGTRRHLQALAACGPCPEHRKTYQPVRDCLLLLFGFEEVRSAESQFQESPAKALR